MLLNLLEMKISMITEHPRQLFAPANTWATLFRVISPAMGAIKTGLATLTNLLAYQALHLPQNNTFALFWMVKTAVKWWGKHQYADSTNLQTSYKDNKYFSLTLTPASGKHCLKYFHSNHLHMPGTMSSQPWPVPALRCIENH